MPALGCAPLDMPLDMTPATEDDVLRVLRDDATTEPGLSDDKLLAMHAALVRARLVGARLDTLAEAGTTGFAPTALGDEALLVGAASALEDGDWVFPSHRDAVIALARGVSTAKLLSHVFGAFAAPSKGRATPGSYGDKAARVVSAGAPTAAHAVQAVGVAWAARKDGVVVLVTLTESMLESGEIHNALNFAGVMKAPVIFVVRGTGDITPSASERGVAYGVGTMKVDGSDALAVHRAVAEARARALRGDGAAIIEAVGQGATDGSAADGAARFARFLAGRGEATSAAAKRADADERRLLDEAVATASRAAAPSAATTFDDVFATLPWHLVEQRDAAARSPSPKR